MKKRSVHKVIAGADIRLLIWLPGQTCLPLSNRELRSSICSVPTEESGLNRSFQYEHGQSRIGGTLWDSPLQYMENSPLFTMDKVETPILIMHNDNDGHVPWYQGIEYFVALKRLQKPVWLLNYTGEVHWPMRLANRIDFQKRMFQFFQHYLNKQPMPKWMDEGVPAVDQEFELGY